MHSSRLIVGFVAVLAVGGLGVAAFAADGGSGGVGGPVASSTTPIDISTTTTGAPTTTTLVTPDQSSTTGDVSDSQDVARSTDGCEGGSYANHGDYVSSVAHDTGREPGDVPAAAQSDCGKPLTAVGGSTTPDEPTSTSETSPALSPPGNGNAGGNGNARGNGNAGGNGKPVK